jgi:hypothetical protein
MSNGPEGKKDKIPQQWEVSEKQKQDLEKAPWKNLGSEVSNSNIEVKWDGTHVNVNAQKSGDLLVVEDQTNWEKVDANREAIPTKKDYLKTPEAFKKAMENFSKWFVDYKVDFDSFASATAKIKNTEGFSQEELKDFYDLLSKWELSRESNMKYTAETFQKLLAKMSLSANEMAKNWGIDWMIWNFTLNAAEQWMEVIIKGYSRQDWLPLLASIWLDVWLGKGLNAKTLDTSVPEWITGLNYEYQPEWYSDNVRIRLRTVVKLPLDWGYKQTVNTAAMLYEQMRWDNLDPYITSDDHSVSLASRDGKWKIVANDNGTIWVYWEDWSLKLKDPSKFKWSVLDGVLNYTKYEGNPNWEAKQIVIKSLKDIENMELYKGSEYRNLVINEINLADVLKIKGSLTLDDAKQVSEKLEKWAEWLKNIKNKDDFTKFWDQGKWALDKLNDIRNQDGNKVDYSDISLEFSPKEFFNLFEATWIFKNSLAFVQTIAWDVWPISFKTWELKQIMDDINQAFWTKSLTGWQTVLTEGLNEEQIKEKIEEQKNAKKRELLDKVIAKTTKFSGVKDAEKNIAKQVLGQTDVATTLTFNETVRNMNKNNENLAVFGEIGKDKSSGMAVMRIDEGNGKIPWFLGIESKGKDIYVKILDNTSVWMKDVRTNTLSLGILPNIYTKEWLKVYLQAVAKVMMVSGMNTANVIVRSGDREVPVWELAKNIWTPTKELPNNIPAIPNWYVWFWAEKTLDNGKWVVKGTLWITGFASKHMKDYSIQFEKGLDGLTFWLTPLATFDAQYDVNNKLSLEASGATDFGPNTQAQVVADYKINDKNSVSAWVGKGSERPVGQRDESTKFNDFGPNTKFNAWASVNRKLGDTWKASIYVANDWMWVSAQKQVRVGNADIKWFVAGWAEFIPWGLTPTVSVWTSINFQPEAYWIKKVFKNGKEKPMTEAQKLANKNLIEKEAKDRLEQEKLAQAEQNKINSGE